MKIVALIKAADGTRCTATRFLHVHHIKHVARGGPNTVDNLRLVCSAHHTLIHGTPGSPEP